MKIWEYLTIKNRKAITVLKADDTTEGSIAYDIKQSSDAIKGAGYTDGTLKAHEDRLDTIEGADTVEGSVAKTVKDAVDPIAGRLDTAELAIAKTNQDLASVKQTLQQGNGATLDFTGIGSVALDARATGRANPTVEGRTATNIVNGADIANLGTVTFASVLNHKYFDVLHGTILTGTGSDITVTNDTGATVDIAVIYLTGVYGLGNEPTASDCAKIFSYFSGTKSIQLPAMVRSVGKNLENLRENKKLLSIGATVVIEEGRTCLNIPNGAHEEVVTGIFEPNTRYTMTMVVKTVNSGRFQFLYTDGTRSGSVPTSSFAVVTSVSEVGKTVESIRFTFAGSGRTYVDLDTFMLYKGSTATPYEPYQDSTLYIADNEELRSVQAVSDTVSVINGEHMLTKKISTPVSVLSGVAVNSTNYPLAKTGGKFSVELTAGGTQIGIIGTDSTSGDGMLRYELATPVTTNLLTSGIIQAKQKGTVYFEPYYEGSHQTNASSQITLPYTGTIDKVTGYDETLEPYEVPSTGYTLVGTLLTITGAEENEVFYVELSRSEPLAPEIGVNTLNNEQVIADTENGKYYKLVPTITDGVLVGQTPVEVV